VPVVPVIRRDLVPRLQTTDFGAALVSHFNRSAPRIIFMVIFGQIAKLSDGTGFQPFAFYLVRHRVVENYFSECFYKTAEDRFRDNASLFGQSLFPRIIVPISIVVSNLCSVPRLQFSLFGRLFGFWLFFEGQIAPQTGRYCCCPFVGFLMAALDPGRRDVALRGLDDEGIVILIYSCSSASSYLNVIATQYPIRFRKSPDRLKGDSVVGIR